MEKDLETKNLPDNKKGITLIALIITVIVLLILAGVTISMVVGDNGVLKQAQNAKIKTEKAKDEELRGLTAAEAGGNLEMTWYQDGENKVPIPAGFAVSQVEGENRVDDGLVIIDSNGNEFVWIPVKDVETGYVRNTDYYNYDSAIADNNYLPDELKNGQSETEEEIEKKLIQESGGFYVGRYEAGVDGDISISTEERNSTLFMEWKSISSL